MKLRNISIYALTMAAGMGLWSCTSDEALSGGEAYGEPIPVTITLSRGDAQTRTELSENAEGGLDDKWLRNDQLVVINSNNEEVGVLEFVKYVDDSKPNEAVFQGTLEGVADGVYDYTLWYLGGNGTQQAPLSEFINDRTVDGSKPMLVKTTLTRQTGKLDDLVRGDLLSKQIKIRVSDHKAAVEQSLDAASRTMTAHLAMASIKLDGVDGVTDGTLKISHAPSNIDPVYKVYFDRYSTSKEASVGAKENPLIIDRVNTSDPVYMVLCPSQYSGNTALVLTLTSGDKTWTATLPDITMEAGKYYRNGADGNQFSVTMTESNKEVKLVYHANFTGATTETYEETQTANNGEVKFTVRNYQQLIDDNRLPTRKDYISFGWSKTPNGEIENLSEITADGSESTIDLYAVWTDQSKNPLRKWAEANLVHLSSTDGADSKGYIPENNATTIKGSLYQWGRNKGWKDYNEARGYVTQLGNATYALTNFNGEVNDYGTGLGHFYLNTDDYVVVPTMSGLTTVEDIKVNPDIWLMNGSISNNNGDYWIGSGGGNDWKTRAKAGGFTYETPAPNGWRLPTKSEFQQITPINKSITGSNNTLKQELNGYSELRQITETGKECKYVIKWEVNSTGINISAIVVPTSFTQVNNLSDIHWKNTNVLDRFFPYTGVIRSSVLNISLTNGNRYIVNGRWVTLSGSFTKYANVYPLCDLSNSDYCSNYDVLGVYLYGYYYSAKINIVKDYSHLVGGYWMADAQEVFYFNTNDGWQNQKSKFCIEGRSTTNPLSPRVDNGYAIRCVKNE